MSTPALEIEGLTKAFGGVRAVDHVSFNVPAGSLTAIIGPNGAGKTTLFNLMTGLYRPDAGTVHLFGSSILGRDLQDIAASGMIRTFQTARVFPVMTARENVMTGAHLRLKSTPLELMLRLPAGRREERTLQLKADAMLDFIGLAAFKNSPATDLPMGAQKLLELGRALMSGPRLLLLDEPAAGLNDSETAALAELLQAMRGAGVTIVLVEHNMSLVMGIADRVVVLDAGALVATGTPGEIQRDPRVVAAYVGMG